MFNIQYDKEIPESGIIGAEVVVFYKTGNSQTIHTSTIDLVVLSPTNHNLNTLRITRDLKVPKAKIIRCEAKVKSITKK